MDARTMYRPAQFFALAIAITWFFWLADAYVTARGGPGDVQGLLMVLGLCGPVLAALIMFRRTGSPELWHDFRDRLVSLRRIDRRTLPFILLFMPAVMCAATGISLLFGKSPSQFTILLGASFTTLPGLIGLFAAPALEEAGWRGYGVDSLRSRSTLFGTSLAFGLLWAFWHTPLLFISGSYHNSLLSSGLYTANFFVSVFAMAFIINWLYDRNNRSVIACFLFHLSANVSMSFIAAEQFTRCIVTVLLLLFAAGTVILDRERYFREMAPGTGSSPGIRPGFPRPWNIRSRKRSGLLSRSPARSVTGIPKPRGEIRSRKRGVPFFPRSCNLVRSIAILPFSRFLGL